jgi:antirestriction protein
MGFDIDELPDIPDGLRPYVKVDIEAWARDMEYSGEISTVESPSGVYVFWPE